MKNETPEYLNNLIPKRKQNFDSRNTYIPSYNCRTEFFESSFFLATLDEWLQFNQRIRSSEPITAFKQKLLPPTFPLENIIFNILDTEGLKLLTRLHLGFFYLNERRFWQNFLKFLINVLCKCSLETQNTCLVALPSLHQFFLLILWIVDSHLLLTLSYYNAIKKLQFSCIDILGKKIKASHLLHLILSKLKVLVVTECFLKINNGLQNV